MRAYRGPGEDGPRLVREGLELAEAADNLELALRGHLNLSDILEMLGRSAQAAATAREGLELAARAGLNRHVLGILLIDLPATDISLLVTLPKLIGPDLQRLRESIEHDDPDWGWDALTAVAEQIDTPQQRAQLADALVGLRDQHR